MRIPGFAPILRPRRARSVTRGARRGFALPVALLLVLVLSIIAASAISLAGAEGGSAKAQLAQVQAMAFARTGMERYLAYQGSPAPGALPPPASQSLRIMFAGGYADVTLNRVRDGTTGVPNLYLIRSHGVRTDPATGQLIVGERTISQYARWQDPALLVPAAWTGFAGLTKRDSLGTIDGTDGCAAVPSIAGVAVPTALDFEAGEASPIVHGAPSIVTFGTSNVLPGVNWASITRGDGTATNAGGAAGLGATVNLATESWPDPGWWAASHYSPTILAGGDLTLPSDGRGLLIVTGDLTVTGGNSWYGVILVGGAIRVTGTLNVNGAVVTGLSALQGGSPAVSDLGLGNSSIVYNSCSIANALSRFRGLAPLRNAMIDSWPTY